MRDFRCNSIRTLHVAWIFVTLTFASLFLQCSAAHSEAYIPASTRFQRRGTGRVWSSQPTQYQRPISSRRLQRFQQLANLGRGGQRLQTQFGNTQQDFGRMAQRQVNRLSQERFRNIQPQVRSGIFDVQYRQNNQNGQTTQIRNSVNVNRPTDRTIPNINVPVNIQWVDQQNAANGNLNNVNNNYNTNIQPRSPTQQRPLVYNPAVASGPPLANTNNVVEKPNPPSIVPINSLAQPSNMANTDTTNDAVRPPVEVRAPYVLSKSAAPLTNVRAEDRLAVQVKPNTVLERKYVMAAVPQEAMLTPTIVKQKQTPILVRQPLVLKDNATRYINLMKDNKVNDSPKGPIILRQKGRNKPYIVVIRKNGKLARKLIQVQRPGMDAKTTKSLNAPLSPRLPDKVAMPTQATPIVYRTPVFSPSTNGQTIPIPVPPVLKPLPKLSPMADISSMIANLGNANSIQYQVSNATNNQGSTPPPPSPQLPPITDMRAMLSNILNANSFQNQVPNVQVPYVTPTSPLLSPINDISVMLSKIANGNTLQIPNQNVNVQSFPQSLNQMLNTRGQSLAGNFGNVGNFQAIGGAMNRVQPGMVNPFASLSQQQPFGQMSMIGSWDGSSANVPLAMQRMGITHGSQLSPAMQEMMFGDSIDPPDPTQAPTPSTIGTTVPVTEATTYLPMTTTQKSKATTTKLRKGTWKNKKNQKKMNKEPAVMKLTSFPPTTPVIPLAALNVVPSITTPNPTDVAVSLAKKLIALMNNGNTAANNFLKALNVDLPPSKTTDSVTIVQQSINPAEPITYKPVIQSLPGTLNNAMPDVSLASFQSSNEIGGVKVERIIRPPAVKIDKRNQNQIEASQKIKIPASLQIVEDAKPLASATKEIVSSKTESSLTALKPALNDSSMSVSVETKPYKQPSSGTQSPILTPIPVETQDNNIPPLQSISKTVMQTSLPAVNQAPIANPMPIENQAPILAPFPSEKNTSSLITKLVELVVPVTAPLPAESQTPVLQVLPTEKKATTSAPLPIESQAPISPFMSPGSKPPILSTSPTGDQTNSSASVTANSLSVGIDEALKMIEFTKGSANESSLDLLIGLLSSMHSSLVTTGQTKTASPTTSSIPPTPVIVVSSTTPPAKIPETPARKAQQPKCTHNHPGFQCKGKDFFASLETTGKWCIATCREKGCVKSVCECNCNGVVRQIIQQNTPNGNLNNENNNKQRQNKWRRWRKPKPTTEEPPEYEEEDMVSTTEAMTTTETPDDFTYGYVMVDSQVTSPSGNNQGPKTLPQQVSWGSESKVHFSNLGVKDVVSKGATDSTTPSNTEWVPSRPPPSWRGTAWELPPAPVKPKKDAKQSGGEEEESKPTTVSWSRGSAGSWEWVTPPNGWNAPARNGWNNNGPRFTGGSRNTWRQPVPPRAGPGAWGNPPPLRESGDNNWNMFGNRRSVDSGFRLRDTWRSSNKPGGEEKEQ